MQMSAQPPPPHPGSMSARSSKYARHGDDRVGGSGLYSSSSHRQSDGRKSLPAFFSSAAATTYPSQQQYNNMADATSNVDYYSTPHHRRHYPYSSHTTPQQQVVRSRSRDNNNVRSDRSFRYDSYNQHQQQHYPSSSSSSAYPALASAPHRDQHRSSHRDRRHRHHHHSSTSSSRSRSPRKSRHSSHRSRSRSSSYHSRRSSSTSSSRSRQRSSGSSSRSHSYSSDSQDGSGSGSESASGSEEGSDSDADSSSRDDTEGLINIKAGEMIRDRYEVISTAGQGTFGTVLDCYDHQSRTRVALKVIRAVERYIEAALVEVDILERIRKADVHNQSLCVKFIRHFHIRHSGREHLVLAFEKLGRSLYEFLKKNSYRGFSLENVARFGFQLLTSIQFCHSIELIHTDLKLENILLKSSEYRTVKDYNRFKQEAAMMDIIQKEEENKRKSRKGGNPVSSSTPSNTSAAASSSSASPAHHSGYASDTVSESSAFLAATAAKQVLTEKANEDEGYREPVDTSIRLIDFGGATFEREHHSRIVNTRQYRAPEVILGCGWSYPSDIWSVGAILVELFTGELLFGTHADLEHLALMEKILEQPISETLTRKAIEPFAKKLGFNREVLANTSTQLIDQASKKRERRKQAKQNKRDSDDASSESSSSSRGRSSSAPRADLLIHLRSAKLLWPECAISDSSIKTVRKAQTLRQLLPDADFLDLVRKLLTFDPAQRITARNALAHPFFRHARREYEKQQEREKVEREKQHRRHSDGHHRHEDRKSSSRVSSSRSDGRRHSDHHHHDRHHQDKHDRHHHHHSPSHRESRHRSSAAKDAPAAAASSSSHSHHQRNASSNKRKRSRSRSSEDDDDQSARSDEEDDDIDEESKEEHFHRSHDRARPYHRSHRDESNDSRGRPSKRKK